MMLEEIETPQVLVDLDITERNVRRYQQWCDDKGLTLRPHIKTHKLPRVARYQVQQGAVGINCQKVSEAEAMCAEGDFDDVLITYNILGAVKLQRTKTLAERLRLTVTADSATTIEGLASVFATATPTLGVMVECDTGARRCGVVTPPEVLALAQQIDGAARRRSGLHFAGLMTYPPTGSSKNETDLEASVQAWLAEAKVLIEAAGIDVPCVSVGGTPNMWKTDAIPLATEWRPGTYVYNDASLVKQSVCDYSDCALTVLATVSSVPQEDRATIDAGSKVLTSDLLGCEGHGHVWGRPDIRIDSLSEEHGRLVSDGPLGLRVGDQVRIVPNHACVVTNMMDTVMLVRGDQIEGPEKVAARGCVW